MCLSFPSIDAHQTVYGAYVDGCHMTIAQMHASRFVCIQNDQTVCEAYVDGHHMTTVQVCVTSFLISKL